MLCGVLSTPACVYVCLCACLLPPAHGSWLLALGVFVCSLVLFQVLVPRVLRYTSFLSVHCCLYAAHFCVFGASVPSAESVHRTLYAPCVNIKSWVLYFLLCDWSFYWGRSRCWIPHLVRISLWLTIHWAEGSVATCVHADDVDVLC